VEKNQIKRLVKKTNKTKNWFKPKQRKKEKNLSEEARFCFFFDVSSF